MHIVFLLLFSLFLASGDQGSGIDPDGVRLRRFSDVGSCIDPMGRPCLQTLGDEGNGFDPHGGRVTGQADRGPGMDPWG